MPNHFWPLFDLEIRTPKLKLCVPDDDMIVQLVERSLTGIHEPGYMPFLNAWTRVPSPCRERRSLQYYWGTRANWKAGAWQLPMAVSVAGELVGVQGIEATNFRELRTVKTGSWLARSHQGQGIGREMRSAVLHLAFSGLEAQRAESSAFDDNQSSIAVSRSCGYRENGDSYELSEGARRRTVLYALERPQWEAKRRHDITIEGLEPCIDFFVAEGPSE